MATLIQTCLGVHTYNNIMQCICECMFVRFMCLGFFIACINSISILCVYLIQWHPMDIGQIKQNSRVDELEDYIR